MTPTRMDSQASILALCTAVQSNEIVDKREDYCMIEGDFVAISAAANQAMETGSPVLPQNGGKPF